MTGFESPLQHSSAEEHLHNKLPNISCQVQFPVTLRIYFAASRSPPRGNRYPAKLRQNFLFNFVESAESPPAQSDFVKLNAIFVVSADACPA